MEQAQFAVLEIDWFIASLQPMRWIKSLAGVQAPAGGAHILLPATSVNHCASAFFGQPMGHSPAIADSRVGSRVGQRSSRCPTARGPYRGLHERVTTTPRAERRKYVRAANIPGMMVSQPASAASACGRSRPCVSEIVPMVRIMLDRTKNAARCHCGSSSSSSRE
jgi:hypothetical protein